MIKLTDPENSLKLYKRAIHIAEVEEKYHDMMGFYEHTISIALRLNKQNEALELIQGVFAVLDRIDGQQEQITKYLLSVVIIYLSRDDWVSAKKYLEETKAKLVISYNLINECLLIKT